MSRLVFYLLVFIAVFLSSKNGFGSAVNIEITPNEVNGLLHNDVLLSCGLDDGDTRVKEVLALVLSRHKKAVAILRQNSRLTIGKDFSGKFQAEGEVSTTVIESYLRVTLSNPWVEDAGDYTCRVYFLNEVGILMEKRTSANLTVMNQEVTSTLKYLVEKLSDVETELGVQREMSTSRLSLLEKEHMEEISTLETRLRNETRAELEQMERENLDKVSILETKLHTQKNETKTKLEQMEKEYMDKETQLENQVNQLTTKINAQEVLLQQMMESLMNKEHKENVTEFFQASHSRSGVFQTGKTLAFDVIIASQGQGYNKNSGVFTAPVAGFYMFQISLYLANDKYIYVDLKTNKDQVLTTIFVGDDGGGWEDYSSGSCVAKLQAGEQVMPVINYISSSFAIKSPYSNNRINTFSGYLLKTL